MTAIDTADHGHRHTCTQHERLTALQQIQASVVPNDQGHGLTMA